MVNQCQYLRYKFLYFYVMQGDHEIVESNTGKSVMLTRRTVLASDEQVRYITTLTVANTFVSNALSDFRNRDALRAVVMEVSGSKYAGQVLRDDIIKEVVANEIVTKMYRVIEKKPKKWGKSG